LLERLFFISSLSACCVVFEKKAWSVRIKFLPLHHSAREVGGVPGGAFREKENIILFLRKEALPLHSLRERRVNRRERFRAACAVLDIWPKREAEAFEVL